MSNIQLEIEKPYNGQFVTFTAPCGCDAVTDGLVINGSTYTIVDAMGECVTGVGGVWTSGAKISAVLDVNNRKAYIQNSGIVNRATVEYVDGIHEELKKSVSDGKTQVADAITAMGVTTATDATFATMAGNIGKIETGTLDDTDVHEVALSTNKHYGETGYQLLCSLNAEKPIKMIRFQAHHKHSDSTTINYSDIFLPFYNIKVRDYEYSNKTNNFVVEPFTPTSKTLVDDISLWYGNDDGGTTGSYGITYIQFSADYKTVYFYALLTDGWNNEYETVTTFNVDYYY